MLEGEKLGELLEGEKPECQEKTDIDPFEQGFEFYGPWIWYKMLLGPGEKKLGELL